MDLMRDEHGLSGTQERFPSAQTIADVYTRAVNSGRPAREVMARDFPMCVPHADQIAELLRAFMARKRVAGQLDFDDLLIAWNALLADPVAGAKLRGRCCEVKKIVDQLKRESGVVAVLSERLLGQIILLTENRAESGAS